MSYYPEPDSYIKDKVKAVLKLSSNTTGKDLDYTTGVDTSDLAAKKYFISLKVEVDKLDTLMVIIFAVIFFSKKIAFRGYYFRGWLV